MLPFEVKAKVVRNKMTLAEFDGEASARIWIKQRRLEGRCELWVKTAEGWVR